MTRTISRAQARLLDQRAVDEFGMTGPMLMENAGRGAADRLVSLGIAGPLLVVCGAGNNGGDGFVIARHLDLRGYQVRALLAADPARLAGDALLNYRVLAKSGVPLASIAAVELAGALAAADWVVDALLGTGAQGEVRPPLDEIIDTINARRQSSTLRVLAVDLPSGLDCDTGQAAQHTIRATHTCTFVAPKPGFFAPNATAYTGQIHVADIGAPRKLIEEILGGTDGG